VDEWIASITDITDLAQEVRSRIRAGVPGPEAARQLPVERVYPLAGDLAARVGASTGEQALPRARQG
jgi:hypothetical protein